MLSGMPSSAISSKSSVRISASARDRSAERERLEIQAVEQLAMDVRLQLDDTAAAAPRRRGRTGAAGVADVVLRTLTTAHRMVPDQRSAEEARRFAPATGVPHPRGPSELPGEAAELRGEFGVVRSASAARPS